MKIYATFSLESSCWVKTLLKKNQRSVDKGAKNQLLMITLIKNQLLMITLTEKPRLVYLPAMNISRSHHEDMMIS